MTRKEISLLHFIILCHPSFDLRCVFNLSMQNILTSTGYRYFYYVQFWCERLIIKLAKWGGGGLDRHLHS
jgi:hypothetical protein